MEHQSTQRARKSGFNWGWGLFLAMVLFMGMVGYFLVRAINHNQPMAVENAYQSELTTDANKRSRAAVQAAGGVDVTWIGQHKTLRLSLPATLAANATGTLTLAHNANDAWDVALPFQANEAGVVSVAVTDYHAGQHLLSVTWTHGSESYAYKQPISL